jgi:hypothetical protein
MADPNDYGNDSFEVDEVPREKGEGKSRPLQASRAEHSATVEGCDVTQPLEFQSLRNTEEYRAAWDVEVWKALQIRQFQSEFKDSKRKQLESFKTSLEAKEKEALSAVDRHSRELTTRERRIVEEERLLERRRQKLGEQERELKSTQRQLEEHRRALDAEAELRVQRVKEEMAHRVELLQQKNAQSEDVNKRTEERLHASQAECMRLFEEFSAFKTRQFGNPDAVVAAQLERMRTDHNLELSSLQDRLDRRHQEQVMSLTHRCQQLEDQVTTLSSALASKKQSGRHKTYEITRLQTNLEHAERRVQQLQREKDDTESKLALAHHRFGELRDDSGAPRETMGSSVVPHQHHQRAPGAVMSSSGGSRQSIRCEGSTEAEAAALRRSVQRMTSGALVDGETVPLPSRNGVGGGLESFSEAQTSLRCEIQRLERERAALLEDTGGVYNTGSLIIRQLDSRILELSQQCVLPLNSGRKRGASS